MKYEQLSLFTDINSTDNNSLIFSIKPKYVMVTVERPDGTYFNQQLMMNILDTPKSCVERYQKKVLGDPYGWYTTKSGRRKPYIKKNAYLVVNYWLEN